MNNPYRFASDVTTPSEARTTCEWAMCDRPGQLVAGWLMCKAHEAEHWAEIDDARRAPGTRYPAVDDDELRRLHSQGLKDREIAQQMNLSTGTITAHRRDLGLYPNRTLKPCGTHAAYTRHISRSEKPCGPCVEAERVYNAARKREQRKDAAA